MKRTVPQGTLILIGGAEDKGEGALEIEDINRDFEKQEILKALLPFNTSKHKKIEIVTTASNVPDDISEMYSDAVARMGFKNIGFINIVNHNEARDPQYIRRINRAHAVLFSGGDQFRLSTILGNTEFLNAIMDRYMNDSDFIIAGTSAGAMSAAVLMMYEGTKHEALLKGMVKVSSGLGIIDRCLIDTHFIRRGRFGRLAQAVIMNPTCTGIGLGEDTALFITKGRLMECRGSGMVVIIDGKDIGHTNIPYAAKDTPLSCENLIVHILADGSGFDLEEKKFIPSKADLIEEDRSRSRQVQSEKDFKRTVAATNSARKRRNKNIKSRKSAVKKDPAKKTGKKNTKKTAHEKKR